MMPQVSTSSSPPHREGWLVRSGWLSPHWNPLIYCIIYIPRVWRFFWWVAQLTYVLILYELMLLTPLLTPRNPPPHSRTCQRVPSCQYLLSNRQSTKAPKTEHQYWGDQWLTLEAADDLTVNCFQDATTWGTQARQLCKGHDNVRDESKAALWGRRRRKGGNNAREAIFVASSLSTQRALIVILLVINNFFSSFNDVDLSHIILVDCCMLCCQECGPIAAVWWRRPPWWSIQLHFTPFYLAILSRHTQQNTAKPKSDH